MKDYGQLIAVAIGIIILIINALNKKKAKQNVPIPPPKKNMNQPQPQTSFPSLDEILREFSGETVTPKAESLESELPQNDESLEETKSLEEISPYEKYNSTDYQYSKSSILYTSNSSEEIQDTIKDHESHEKEEIIEENNIEFNIRTAILFSEILKRPNY